MRLPSADQTKPGGDETKNTNPDLTNPTKCPGLTYGHNGAIPCQLFPANSPWNVEVSQMRVHPNSSAYLASIDSAAHLHPDLSMPYMVVPSDQAPVPITFGDYADSSMAGPYSIPSDVVVEPGSGHHVIILQADSQGLPAKLFEIWEFSGSASAGYGATFGMWFDVRVNDQHRRPGDTSADAAGLAILPGIVRFGGRLRLKESFDISTYSATNQIILKAMKKYGFIVADIGGDLFYNGADDARFNQDDLTKVFNIKKDSFEFLEAGAPLVDER